MTSRNPIIDSEIFDLIARLRHLQDETELLAAQQRELQRQLQIVEKTARDEIEDIS